jgi:FixJ family two-component response regulator
MSLAHAFGRELSSSPASLETPVVYVVDSDVAVRDALESIIDNQGWDCETFASAQEFIRTPRNSAPSCLVLAVGSPRVNGLELQKRIAAERPETPIICTASRSDVPTTVQAMKAGAVEFFTKPFKPSDLICAMLDALEHSRAVLAHQAETNSLQGCYESLTRREREVLGLVIAGLLNKQVGGELGISEITVKAHRGQVMQKMKADSLADLVRMGVRLGLGHTRPSAQATRGVGLHLVPAHA